MHALDVSKRGPQSESLVPIPIPRPKTSSSAPATARNMTRRVSSAAQPLLLACLLPWLLELRACCALPSSQTSAASAGSCWHFSLLYSPTSLHRCPPPCRQEGPWPCPPQPGTGSRHRERQRHRAAEPVDGDRFPGRRAAVVGITPQRQHSPAACLRLGSSSAALGVS